MVRAEGHRDGSVDGAGDDLEGHDPIDAAIAAAADDDPHALDVLLQMVGVSSLLDDDVMM